MGCSMGANETRINLNLFEFEPDARFSKRATLHERLNIFQNFKMFARSGRGGLSARISTYPRDEKPTI